MAPGLATFLMFLFLIGGVVIGFPIAFVLSGTAVIFGYVGFGPGIINLFSQRVYGLMTNFIMAAIPLFIFMGAMLDKSGIAEAAYDNLYKMLGKLKGGLAITTIIVCTLFAATTGIVGASVTTMGVIALPAMINRNYDKSLATGVIGAGGTLGILIPPSIMLVLFAPMAGLSIVKLFSAAIVPGLLLSGLYVLYVVVRTNLNPEMGPPVPEEDRPPLKESLIGSLKTLVPFLFLILSVLGSIFFGLASPTEAAGMGAFGSIIIAFFFGGLTWENIKDSLRSTLVITSFVMMVALGANLFTGVFFGIGGDKVIIDLLMNLGLGSWGVLIVILFLVFILGMFIDWIGILLILTPIFMPILTEFGFDPLWSGMLIILMLQSSFLTPPFAYSLFYIRGVAPPSVTIEHIYRGVIPFVLIQLLGLGLAMSFPSIITWLPSIM